MPTRRAPAASQNQHGTDCGRTALRRVLFIHERLGNQQSVTAVSLARELETSERTIKRDLEFMRDELGAPIEWSHATHSYCYTRDCDILPLLRIDAAEALALLLARETFAAWGGSALGRALTAALGKIAGVIGGAVSIPASEVSGLIFRPETNSAEAAEQRCFATALEAIRRRRALRLDYWKPGTTRGELRVVHPLHLALLDHRWVLIAHDPARNGRRNFLLSRIRQAAATPTTFSPPASFNLKTYLRGSLGRFTGDSEIEIRLALAPALAPYLQENPWHPSQVLAERPDGRLGCTLRLNNTIDVRRRILACGAHAEVLAPPDLRTSIQAEIQAMAARYAPPDTPVLLAAAEPPGTYSPRQPVSRSIE